MSRRERDFQDMLRIWIEPRSREVMLESPRGIIMFDTLDDMREYCVAILNKANEFEHKMRPPSKNKGRMVAKNYAAKAIKEWEESMEQNKDDNSPDSEHSSGI